MENSIYLARIVGPVFAVVGLGLLLNSRRFSKLIDDFFGNSAILYLSGFFALILGLVMVQYHNEWQLHWRVVLTVLGWMACVKGAALIVLPELFGKAARIFGDPRIYIVVGIGYLAAGGFFIMVGYCPCAGI